MPLVKLPRYKEFLALLRERLPEKKVTHSVFVGEYATSIAKAAGVDHNEAAAAGLLHDLCRTLAKEALLQRAQEYGLEITEAHWKTPVLLHGPVAAEELRREHGVDSEAVYEAVFWHTTGKAGLHRVGQVLYFADFAEPMRPYAEAAEARDLVRSQGFDAALRFAVDAKLHYVQKKNAQTPDGEAFFQWLQQGGA